MNKVVLFGPMPPPLHGVSLSLQCFAIYCESIGYAVEIHATNLRRPVVSPGRRGLADIVAMSRLTWNALRVSRSDLKQTAYLACATKDWPVFRDLLLAAILRLRGRRVVVHFQGTELADATGFLRKLIRSVYGPCDKVYGSLELMLLQAGLHNESARVDVIPNGVPDHQLISLEERFSRDIGPPLHVLFLSNILSTKGFLEFLDTLSCLRERNFPFRASICGGWSTDFPKERVMMELEIRGLNSSIERLGAVDGTHKMQALADCDVLLFPSHRESFGNVVIEAMSAGVVVIANSTMAMPTILDRGRCGFELHPYTANEAATIVCGLTPCIRKNMAAAARARYEELYTSELHNERLIHFVASVP